MGNIGIPNAVNNLFQAFEPLAGSNEVIVYTGTANLSPDIKGNRTR